MHTSKSQAVADRLKNEYTRLTKRRIIVFGEVTMIVIFYAELVESVIVKMSRGKAAGVDGITVEHLQYSPVISGGCCHMY